MTMIKDKLGRRVNYLRISVTDRCNLRCIYCGQGKDFKFLPHREILTYEEILRLISIGEKLGVEKVRLTGGEPFIRKGFLDFLSNVMQKFPNIDLRITTNGTLLSKDVISRLKNIGIRAINVSLDSFSEKIFRYITKSGNVYSVLDAINCLIQENIKTKLNVVALKNINYKEIIRFARFAYNNPVDVRFIEFMDLTKDNKWNHIFFISGEEIVEQINKEFELIPEILEKDTKGPARMYKIKGGRGRIGIISPMSNHFCNSCNRFRITADGKLKTCLFSKKSYSLKGLLRNDKVSDELILKAIFKAGERKPIGREILVNDKGEYLGMYKIGG